MNFLQICRDVRLKTGLQGTGPSTVVSASGIEELLVGAVKDAYDNIQNFREEWRWLLGREDVTLPDSSTERNLSQALGPSYRFKKWYKSRFYAKKTGEDSYYPVYWMDWEDFIYYNINITDAQDLRYFSIRPEDKAIVYPLLNGEHTLKVEYQKSNQVLSADTDVPELPLDFHRLIVYAAVEIMSAQVGNPGIYDQYSQDQIRLTNALMRQELPRKRAYSFGIA